MGFYISQRKEEQMSCPIDATTGFLEITGQITPTQLKPIEINAPPLTFQFAPRAVPPTLVGNRIEENVQNTLLYKSIRYELMDVQLTASTHRGYNSISSSLGSPIFEVNLTFFSNQAPKTYPSILLLVVPVYSGQEIYHATYFQQLLDTDASAISIQSLFFENSTDTLAKSFSYQTCIDLVGETNQSLQARVFVFPFGASLSQQLATQVYTAAASNTNGVLPPYMLEKGLIGNSSTVLRYEVNADGEKVPMQTSEDGTIANITISPVSESFANLLQFYVKPPLLAGTANASEQCGLPTQDYKCVPFDALKDLSGNQVVLGHGQTLEQILVKQQSQQQEGWFGSGTSTGLLIAMIIIGVFPILLVITPMIIYGITSIIRWVFAMATKRGVAVNATAAAAAGAVGAAAGVAAGAAGAAGVAAGAATGAAGVAAGAAAGVGTAAP
jgi:hypothetical protein